MCAQFAQDCVVWFDLVLRTDKGRVEGQETTGEVLVYQVDCYAYILPISGRE